MYTDCLLVILISLASALLSEGISYLLIYRTEEYKRLKRNIDQLSRKIDKKRDAVMPADKARGKEKRVAALDELLKAKGRDMAMIKFKSTFFVLFTFISVFGLLNNLFDGRPVAKLPFAPLPLIQGITHRNLPGQDMTECSMLFIYILCSMSIRSSVQRFFGFTPPKGAGNPFAPPGAAGPSPW